MLTICPRCYGSPAVVCCALCRGVRYVAETLELAYRALPNKSVGATINLRNNQASSA